MNETDERWAKIKCDLCGSTTNLSNWDGWPINMDFCETCEKTRMKECDQLFANHAIYYLERAREAAKKRNK